MNDDLHQKVIEDFGNEWQLFDQSSVSQEELLSQFNRYFNTEHFSEIKDRTNLKIIDFGAGSGRWTSIMLDHFPESSITAVEPSDAVNVLHKRFSGMETVTIKKLSFEELEASGIEYGSFDLVSCFGVLHHTRSIEDNFHQLVRLAKKDGLIFCYIYYDLDFRPLWYRAIWKLSSYPRGAISRLSHFPKSIVCELIALTIYLPVVLLGKLFPKRVQHHLPLYGYFDRSFYSMRTDARDRFGTRVEKRMSKQEILKMCDRNQLLEVQFSETHPFWVFSCKK